MHAYMHTSTTARTRPTPFDIIFYPEAEQPTVDPPGSAPPLCRTRLGPAPEQSPARPRPSAPLNRARARLGPAPLRSPCSSGPAPEQSPARPRPSAESLLFRPRPSAEPGSAPPLHRAPLGFRPSAEVMQSPPSAESLLFRPRPSAEPYSGPSLRWLRPFAVEPGAERPSPHCGLSFLWPRTVRSCLSELRSTWGGIKPAGGPHKKPETILDKGFQDQHLHLDIR
ncbi:uncharacterized protein [Notamacropus eugenii]|uniref:uncharacterized protein n=1 Tax=Notamacropus eugenii TaxID=9315 RepID=UPI003B67F62C